jgi:hypothetical protein
MIAMDDKFDKLKEECKNLDLRVTDLEKRLSFTNEKLDNHSS